ncbi:MAG: glycosyltransferase family 4 protein, partial [Anaerolineae bacterium]|nr:glycosyltransferase family 4 protein [Anaerolineae bacterium]
MRIGIPLIQGELNGRRGWVAGFYYIRNCLNALAMLPTEVVPNVTLFMPETFTETVIFPEYADKAIWLNIIRIPDQIISTPGNHADLEKQINTHPCDIIFPLISLPPFTLSSPALGWIPDFQHKHRPDFFSEDEYRIRELMFGFIVGYCNKVVCSSQAVKVDLQNFYPNSPNKGIVLKFTSIIPEQYLTQTPEPVLRRLGLNRKYIYLPNQFWIHKNHKIVFEAWKHLKDLGVDYLLVCTGSREDYRFPNYYQELETYIDEHDLHTNIRLLGFLSREEQIQLYRGASAILQPSLFEGWSTSIEDAKSLGKALIVSDIPVHREQCGSEAHYFDKNNAEALAIMLQQVWNSLPDGYDADAETKG